MKKSIKLMTSYLLFPLVLVSGISFVVYGLRQGWPNFPVTFGTLIAVIIILAVFERLAPFAPEWNIPRNDVKTDVIHMFISQVGVPRLLKVVSIALFSGFSVYMAERFGLDLWPDHWSLALQLAYGLVLTEFGRYWVHRWGHEVDFLWRFHATHHSPERLYWMNAGRFHPVDKLLNVIPATVTLVLMGAGEEVITMHFVFTGIKGLFQHSNFDMKIGIFNYVFSLAEVHRWHHVKDVYLSRVNYGNDLIIWDHLFGTFYWPKNVLPPVDIGIADMNFPHSYMEQLLSPFQWQKYVLPVREKK